MAFVLNDIERKVTWKWAFQFGGVALVIFTPIYILVRVGGVHPTGPLLVGCVFFVSALIPISKKLPKQKREILRLCDDGAIDLLLSKDPHQAVGSWWRHRIRIDANALDRIRVAQSQAETSLPDVRWWYWIRFESGSECLDTWIPDGVDYSMPDAMKTIEQEVGVPVIQEKPIGVRRAHRHRRQQRKQVVPERKWPESL